MHALDIKRPSVCILLPVWRSRDICRFIWAATLISLSLSKCLSAGAESSFSTCAWRQKLNIDAQNKKGGGCIMGAGVVSRSQRSLYITHRLTLCLCARVPRGESGATIRKCCRCHQWCADLPQHWQVTASTSPASGLILPKPDERRRREHTKHSCQSSKVPFFFTFTSTTTCYCADFRSLFNTNFIPSGWSTRSVTSTDRKETDSVLVKAVRFLVTSSPGSMESLFFFSSSLWAG